MLFGDNAIAIAVPNDPAPKIVVFIFYLLNKGLSWRRLYIIYYVVLRIELVLIIVLLIIVLVINV
ncbi:putative membrane protein [Ehrlichia japonica]|uniref:Putative membrane protein n=1 Tax=Ehrlichia japonica TaxID=391036 RepID=X5GC18_9RICK|nr:putative membrane protein [Ehrlichia japonica]